MTATSGAGISLAPRPAGEVRREKLGHVVGVFAEVAAREGGARFAVLVVIDGPANKHGRRLECVVFRAQRVSRVLQVDSQRGKAG